MECLKIKVNRRAECKEGDLRKLGGGKSAEIGKKQATMSGANGNPHIWYVRPEKREVIPPEVVLVIA